MMRNEKLLNKALADDLETQDRRAALEALRTSFWLGSKRNRAKTLLEGAEFSRQPTVLVSSQIGLPGIAVLV
jgi:geranylgeranyl pyrophosphate synthase